MEKFVRGDVVVMPYPYTNLKETKRRPAVIISKPIERDYIVCPITTQIQKDVYCVGLTNTDFQEGNLTNPTNFIRSNKPFTVDYSVILYKIGTIRDICVQNVIDRLTHFLNE